jgi:uncharacterized protein
MGSWVTDCAEVLSPAARAKVDRLAERVRAATNAEVAVVTVPDVSGTPKSFATRLFNYWGVGDPVLNNGALVLVVPGQRRVEVEIGTGLDASFNRDEWLQGVTDAMSQRFRYGDFDGGVLSGVRLIDQRLRSLDEAALVESANALSIKMKIKGLQTTAGIRALAGAGALVASTSLYLDNERSRPICGRCGKRMAPVRRQGDGAWTDDEVSAAQALVQRLLTDEERLEQRLGSCTFSLCSCSNPGCVVHRADATRADGWGEVNDAAMEKLIETYQTLSVGRAKNVLSRYGSCPRCGRRTCETKTNVLRSPTYSRTGAKERFRSCANCAFSDKRVLVIPQLEESTTSSSSSSRGFSGGRSAGTGRGSSW